MKKQPVRTALLALTLFACSAEEPHFPCDLRVDPEFTDADRCLIAEAASRWFEATNGYVDIRPSLGELVGHRILLERGVYAKDPGAEGVAQLSGASVWIFADVIAERHPDDRDREFLGIVMHELGHHVGLSHQTAGLMRQSPEYPCVGQLDLDQLCLIDHECFSARACAPAPTWCGP